jgi:hypothetical protein
MQIGVLGDFLFEKEYHQAARPRKSSWLKKKLKIVNK